MKSLAVLDKVRARLNLILDFLDTHRSDMDPEMFKDIVKAFNELEVTLNEIGQDYNR